MDSAARVALEVLREIADEASSKDASNVIHVIANTLEQEIAELHRQIAQY